MIAIGLGLGMRMSAPATGSAAGTGGHTQWRLLVLSSFDASSVNVAEVQFRTVAGVSQQATGGSSIASQRQGSADFESDKAFDGSTGFNNMWFVGDGSPAGEWIGYTFGSAITPVQVAIHSGNNPTSLIKSFKVQYADGGAWTDAGTFDLGSVTAGTWYTVNL